MLQWTHGLRNLCSTSLVCLFSDWNRFSRKNRVCFWSIGVRVRLQSPTLPLYYEGKVKKTIFPQDFVYVLRTRKNSPHGKFHRLLFSFASKFSDLNFASYRSLYFTHVMSRVTHSEPGLPMVWQCEVIYNYWMRFL